MVFCVDGMRFMSDYIGIAIGLFVIEY